MAIEKIEAAGATGAIARRASSLALLLCAFGIFGAMFGVWQVLLADLSRALGLSPGPLGVALAVGFALSIPALSLGGRLVDRLGLRATIVAAGLVLGLGVAAMALLGHFWQLVLLLPPFYAATGIYDVGINAAAVRVEALSGRRVLPHLHAAFSGGGAAGALSAGALVTAGVPFRLLYVGVALLVGLVMIWAWYGDLPQNAADAPPETADTARLLRNPALLLIAIITVLALLSEGTMENWSAIYLRSSLELPALLGASGVATFHLAMTIGRLSTAGALRFVRRLTLLRLSGGIGAAGMALSLATTWPPLILCGFLLVGLSFSGVVPVALSLTGDLAPDHAGRATSAVMTVAYAGFLVGPPVIGGLAEAFGLRVALATLILCGATTAALASTRFARRALDKG
jgi:MFS family permease